MCAALSSIAGVGTNSLFRTTRLTRPVRLNRTIICIGWDPEGVLGPPQGGHIARFEFKKWLQQDAGAREDFEHQVREEKARRQALRQSRVVPDNVVELIEYFFDTEAQDIEFEIARLHTRYDIVA